VPSLDPLPTFDLYAELDVPYDAGADAIERKWRARVRRSHPDLASTADAHDATAHTARLNIAREWLTDPTRRARYDSLRKPAHHYPLPVTDPLAPWATPRRSTWRFGRAGATVPAFLALAFLLAIVTVGIGTSVVTVGLFALSLTLFVYFGLMSLR
jgi:hypothetical protein